MSWSIWGGVRVGPAIGLLGGGDPHDLQQARRVVDGVDDDLVRVGVPGDEVRGGHLDGLATEPQVTGFDRSALPVEVPGLVLAGRGRPACTR